MVKLSGVGDCSAEFNHTRIKSINLDFKHPEFPHPSGAANGTWRKLIGKPATRENRINFLLPKVFAYLSEL